MDLLLIARKIWRHKLVTLPVIALTLVGAVYTLGVKQPLYEATASYLLVNPPLPPTDEEIARDPALGKVKADNPYTRFTDQSVIIDVLARRMSAVSVKRELVRDGADPRFTVGPAEHFGGTSPILQVTGTGATPQASIKTARVVGGEMAVELDRMQAKDVDARYRITAQMVEAPDAPQLQASGQLRMLVAVCVLGAIVMFMVVSITDALDSLRRERWEAVVKDAWTAHDLTIIDPEAGPERTVGTNGAGDGRQLTAGWSAPSGSEE